MNLQCPCDIPAFKRGRLKQDKLREIWRCSNGRIFLSGRRLTFAFCPVTFFLVEFSAQTRVVTFSQTLQQLCSISTKIMGSYWVASVGHAANFVHHMLDDKTSNQLICSLDKMLYSYIPVQWPCWVPKPVITSDHDAAWGQFQQRAGVFRMRRELFFHRTCWTGWIWYSMWYHPQIVFGMLWGFHWLYAQYLSSNLSWFRDTTI